MDHTTGGWPGLGSYPTFIKGLFGSPLTTECGALEVFLALEPRPVRLPGKIRRAPTSRRAFPRLRFWVFFVIKSSDVNKSEK